jgi:hypothetical protein
MVASHRTFRMSCGSQTVPFGSTFSLLPLVLHFELFSMSAYGSGPLAPAPCNARCSVSSRRAKNVSVSAESAVSRHDTHIANALT